MLELRYPETAAEASTLRRDWGDEFKSGGTDVLSRYRNDPPSSNKLVDLSRVTELRGIRVGDESVRLGAWTSLQDLAANADLGKRLPALSAAARHSATPQIRAAARLGGALCQQVRCVYYRNPNYRCLRKGGDECFAQDGDNADMGIYQNTVCCAVHPSTIGATLLALNAKLTVRAPHGVATLSMQSFFDIDPAQADQDNSLPPDAVIEAVEVPLAGSDRRQCYVRASPQVLADWASVEVVVVLDLDDDVVESAAVVLGAVGRVPRHATAVEDSLRGRRLDQSTIERAARQAAEGAEPLRHNRYKIELANNATRAALLELSRA